VAVISKTLALSAAKLLRPLLMKKPPKPVKPKPKPVPMSLHKFGNLSATRPKRLSMA